MKRLLYFNVLGEHFFKTSLEVSLKPRALQKGIQKQKLKKL